MPRKPAAKAAKKSTTRLKPKPTTAPLGSGSEDAFLDPRKEYLAGGILSRNFGLKPLGSGGTVLAPTPDDLMREFGFQIYDQMAKDPKIAKCIKLLKVSVLGDGVSFVPNKSDNDPEYQNSKAIADFCTYAVRNMRKPLKVALEQMLDAIKYGHKIAEVVYKNEYIDELGGTYLTIDSIKPKPVGTARFVVDDALNIIGITGNNKLAASTTIALIS